MGLAEGAALQLQQASQRPHCKCGSQGHCAAAVADNGGSAAVVAAEGARLQLFQSMRLRCSCGNHWSCASCVAADMLSCSCDSQ